MCCRICCNYLSRALSRFVVSRVVYSSSYFFMNVDVFGIVCLLKFVLLKLNLGFFV